MYIRGLICAKSFARGDWLINMAHFILTEPIGVHGSAQGERALRVAHCGKRQPADCKLTALAGGHVAFEQGRVDMVSRGSQGAGERA